MPVGAPRVKGSPQGQAPWVRYRAAMRFLSRLLAVLAVLGIAGFAACQLLPDGYAVNAPIMNTLFGSTAEPPADAVVEQRIRAAAGFGVEVYAAVPQARFLRPTPAGDLLVSVPRQGKVVRLEADRNGDGRADSVTDLLTGLDRPHGLELHDGWLYVAEGSAIFRTRFDAATGTVDDEREVVVTGLPDGGNHWTKTVRIGPDGALYVSVGSSCNVCFEEDERRAAMLRFPAGGGEGSIHAIGLRNSVGFDWHPTTGALYATDNGRDLLGDDFPPCELNLVVEGGDYGWPVANGDRVIDPDLGAGYEERVKASIPPAHPFAAHNAPLGIAFLREPLPGDDRPVALVALHGSWNRSRKDGYEVVSLHFGEDGRIEERDFLWGFLEDDGVIGRPVDVAQGPDGAIYVSDDYAGAIYRVRPGRAAAAPGAGSAAAAQDPLAALSEDEIQAAGERGAALYERFACASCHEPAEAAAGVVPVPLESLASRFDLDGLDAFLAAPTPPMPSFPLDEQQRRDLSVHLLVEDRASASR